MKLNHTSGVFWLMFGYIRLQNHHFHKRLTALGKYAKPWSVYSAVSRVFLQVFSAEERSLIQLVKGARRLSRNPGQYDDEGNAWCESSKKNLGRLRSSRRMGSQGTRDQRNFRRYKKKNIARITGTALPVRANRSFTSVSREREGRSRVQTWRSKSKKKKEKQCHACRGMCGTHRSCRGPGVGRWGVTNEDDVKWRHAGRGNSA